MILLLPETGGPGLSAFFYLAASNKVYDQRYPGGAADKFNE